MPFAVRVVAVPPGRARAYDAVEWRDALVLVARGEIELEGVGGGCECFRRGAILSLDGLPLRALRNRGTVSTSLVAVSRGR